MTGRVIAVVTREENLSSPRLSLGFEAWTIAAADTLCQMIARGEYPYDSTPQVTAHGVPASWTARSCSTPRAASCRSPPTRCPAWLAWASAMTSREKSWLRKSPT